MKLNKKKIKDFLIYIGVLVEPTTLPTELYFSDYNEYLQALEDYETSAGIEIAYNNFNELDGGVIGLLIRRQ